MYNQSTNTPPSKANPIIIITILIQIIIIITVVVSIISITNKNNENNNTPPTEAAEELFISNVNQQAPQLLQSEYNKIILYLEDAIGLNNNPGNQTTNPKLFIRENTVKEQYFANMDIHQINFIIDIPEINQSYQVNHLWSLNNRNKNIPKQYQTMVYCLDEATFECRDRFANTAPQIIQSWTFN